MGNAVSSAQLGCRTRLDAICCRLPELQRLRAKAPCNWPDSEGLDQSSEYCERILSRPGTCPCFHQSISKFEDWFWTTRLLLIVSTSKLWFIVLVRSHGDDTHSKGLRPCRPVHLRTMSPKDCDCRLAMELVSNLVDGCSTVAAPL